MPIEADEVGGPEVLHCGGLPAPEPGPGKLRPVVRHVYPFEEAAAAHRLIEERRSIGKVVLVP